MIIFEHLSPSLTAQFINDYLLLEAFILDSAPLLPGTNVGEVQDIQLNFNISSRRNSLLYNCIPCNIWDILLLKMYSSYIENSSSTGCLAALLPLPNSWEIDCPCHLLTTCHFQPGSVVSSVWKQRRVPLSVWIQKDMQDLHLCD